MSNDRSLFWTRIGAIAGVVGTFVAAVAYLTEHHQGLAATASNTVASDPAASPAQASTSPSTSQTDALASPQGSARTQAPAAPTPGDSPTSDTSPANPPSTNDVTSSERHAISFVEGYFETLTNYQEVSIDNVSNYYADQVNFFGKDWDNKEVSWLFTLIARNWPVRAYNIEPNTARAKCTGDSCSVWGTYHWNASNNGINSSTSGKTEFLFEMSHDKITLESGRVLTSEYDPGAGDNGRRLDAVPH